MKRLTITPDVHSAPETTDGRACQAWFIGAASAPNSAITISTTADGTATVVDVQAYGFQ